VNKNLIKLYVDLPEKKADLIVLILTSQHIDHVVEKKNKSFAILVNQMDSKTAHTAIESYYKENRFFRLKQPLQEFPLSSFKSITAFSIMGLLCIIHAACLEYQIHDNMILKYGASAFFILQGEIHRAITALFFHSDVRHLVGNMAGLFIFGAPLITLSGYGVGPFMLLLSGMLGNLMNAQLYQTAHLSIGSSTAIMGATGLLAAHQFTHGKKQFRLNNLMPLFAGAILVSLFSQGERTDIWAHFFGFLCGLASGIILLPLNRIIKFHLKDPIALIITLTIVISAFMSGK